MSDFTDKDDFEDELTEEEQKKIITLIEENKHKEVIMSKEEEKNPIDLINSALLGAVSLPPIQNLVVAPFNFGRIIGLNPVVTVNNISGKKAWVIISPVPINYLQSIGNNNFGQVSFAFMGDLKSQQSVIGDNCSVKFELDHSQIYYSLFFEIDGKWRTPFKNRRINTRKYNINILEKHVIDAVEEDLTPKMV
jgi:hypothetical protein